MTMPDATTLSTAATPFGEISYFTFDNPIGAALGRYGEWAMSEIRFLRQFIAVGDTVVDGGANIGTHMLAFADACGPSGRVIAIEASPEIARLLERNIARNGLDQARAINAALGEAEGACLIGRIDPGQPQNAGMLQTGEAQDPGADRTQRLPIGMIALDSLALDALALLKLDVEGGELAVLRGGLATIRRHRPVIVTELLDLRHALPVIDLLAEEGYKPFFCSFAAYNPDNHGGVAENMFGVAREASLLFLPDAATVPDLTPGAHVAAVLDADGLARLLAEMPRYGDATAHDRVAARVVAERDALRRTLDDAMAAPPVATIDEARFRGEIEHIWQALADPKVRAGSGDPDPALDALRADFMATREADRRRVEGLAAVGEQERAAGAQARALVRSLVTRIDDADTRMRAIEARVEAQDDALTRAGDALDAMREEGARSTGALRDELDEAIARVKGEVTSLRQILIGRADDKGRLALTLDALGKRVTGEIEALRKRVDARFARDGDRLREGGEALRALRDETDALRTTLARLETAAGEAEARRQAPPGGFLRRVTDIGGR